MSLYKVKMTRLVYKTVEVSIEADQDPYDKAYELAAEWDDKKDYDKTDTEIDLREIHDYNQEGNSTI